MQLKSVRQTPSASATSHVLWEAQHAKATDARQATEGANDQAGRAVRKARQREAGLLDEELVPSSRHAEAAVQDDSRGEVGSLPAVSGLYESPDGAWREA